HGFVAYENQTFSFRVTGVSDWNWNFVNFINKYGMHWLFDFLICDIEILELSLGLCVCSHIMPIIFVMSNFINTHENSDEPANRESLFLTLDIYAMMLKQNH
ncbi:hypothetical protein ACJX0J_015822, partial [Zea mays]